jgi:protein-disulfide isomerase
MEASLPLTDDAVLGIARSLGVDMARLQQDMANPSIDNELKANVQLAKQLKLIGTPAFIIGKTQNSDKETSFLVPGPTPQSTLQQMISQSSGF